MGDKPFDMPGFLAKFVKEARKKGFYNEADAVEDATNGLRQCDDCGIASSDLIQKGDHHGGTKTVCRDRDACHARSP